jgi:hypothetical protein
MRVEAKGGMSDQLLIVSEKIDDHLIVNFIA